MNVKQFVSIVVCCAVLLVVASCTAPAASNGSAELAATIFPTEPAATATPEVAPEAAVVLAMVERANAGDYAGAAEYVSGDFRAYFLGMPPTGFEFYEGKATWQKFLEDCCTGQNFEWEVVPTEVNNGVVYTESKTWMDFTRELGVAPNDWHEVFIVEDGKITGYWSLITEEALAEFRPALCAALPEACPELVVADTGDPVSEMTITIENGTCVYGGPTILQAGEVAVNLQVKDETGDKYAVVLATLDQEHDFVDLMASTYGLPPEWSDPFFMRELTPDETVTRNVVMDEGQVYMVCWADPPGWPIGQAGPFEVRP